MRKTRAEILIELQRRFGPNENTGHLIDWVLDLWETRDFLQKLVGQDDTRTILEATDFSLFDASSEKRVLHPFASDDLNSSSLN